VANQRLRVFEVVRKQQGQRVRDLFALTEGRRVAGRLFDARAPNELGADVSPWHQGDEAWRWLRSYRR
jgi:hypothetical protein